MDGLLLALIACMAGELGDRSQLLSHVLAQRYRNGLWVAAGLGLAVTANSAISAYVGTLLGHQMNDDARHLFMALGFFAGGLTMWWPLRAPDMLSNWRLGAFGTSFLGLFILGFGESAQFLIAGIAVARGDPALTAVGGALGIFAACLPGIMVGQAFFSHVPLRLLRRVAGCLFLIIGGTIAVQSLGLT